jgi:hypothetical protein
MRGLRRDYTPTPTRKFTKAYLLGALHDATERKLTYRISQKSREYVQFLAQGIESLGKKAWTYKEGKNRNLYIVEFSKKFLKGTKIISQQEKIDYIRGYFDTEGGIAKSSKVRYYIYFAQKDFKDLKELKKYLTEIGIACGKIHNPSIKADPHYWRFYVRAKSYYDFAKIIGSWHPAKSNFLRKKR